MWEKLFPVVVHKGYTKSLIKVLIVKFSYVFSTSYEICDYEICDYAPVKQIVKKITFSFQLFLDILFHNKLLHLCGLLGIVIQTSCCRSETSYLWCTLIRSLERPLVLMRQHNTWCSPLALSDSSKSLLHVNIPLMKGEMPVV